MLIESSESRVAQPDSVRPESAASQAQMSAAVGPIVATEHEKARRAAVSVISIIGTMLIFRMTALIDPLFALPSPVLYGVTGALFGALAGAVQRADETEDRIMHALIGATLLGIVLVLFSLGDPKPRFWRYG